MRRGSISVLLATAVALLLPSLCGALLPEAVRAASVAVGLLLLPGDILADAAGLEIETFAERLGIAFTFSLALLVPALLFALAAGVGVPSVVAVLLACTLLAWAAARVRTAGPRSSPRTPNEETAAGAWLVAITVATMIVLTVAAVAATRTGSVDRWWYLGYVRAWAGGPFFAHEPFLGTDVVQPRFAFHTWLGALAVWSRLAGVDPLWIFDRACPALLMPLAFAAHLTFGRTLFRSARGAWLTALCAALLWAGGGPIAALTRLPEDKVLAAVVLAPMLWAFGMRACESAGAWTLATALAALAIATIHPLGFLIAAGPLIAFMTLRAWAAPQSRRAVAALALVLAVASAYPLASGFVVRQAYVGDGAAALNADHPVARVHRSRQRLVRVGKLGYVVDPHLLAHPVIWIGLAAVPLLRRRRREAAFLVPATLVPLAIAFIPPLGAAAGAVILPWMVHRVLWAIPFGALAAVTAEACTSRTGGRSGMVALALLVISLPWARSAAADRMRSEREALALPANPQLERALAAVRALPPDALLAAAPELSERIPGLTGAHVLAMSDRATIVFAGTRAAGEARLRERADIFAGRWKPAGDAPTPTHVLFAPGAIASRYCAMPLAHGDTFVLCTFEPTTAPARIVDTEKNESADGILRVSVPRLLSAMPATSTVFTPANPLSARCLPQPRLGIPGPNGLTRSRGGPWSFEFPLLSCTIADPVSPISPRTLVLVPALGTAVDELVVEASGYRGEAERWRVDARRRVHDGDTLRLALPTEPVDHVDVSVAPSFLPFVKLRGFELTLGETANR